jgi:hypothetical protein
LQYLEADFWPSKASIRKPRRGCPTGVLLAN